ncbi:unnamed protein product [Rotaria sordida]|uniref:Uncharacterized protein n=1 Tax=Rotaria sordida TaxID=392033 RepID=A0A819RN85_9BILA|nr:unnamed protein product [Rotaria sordida]CAF1069339.1 unnamed protein product [Rotaria sordida]CAF4044825.1 unnamed protein product [Rotaria sordida]CAF4116554.1 unnamed protein product [Rotaria sordida]
MEISKRFDSIARKIKIVSYSITDKLPEEMGKLKIFFMLMGDIKSLHGKQKFRDTLTLHPQWNCIYSIDHTYWDGSLNDGRDRSNQPYYCPVGWKRYSLYVTDKFDEKFKGWCICYHGTKFSYGLSILLSGLAPATTKAHGSGIYLSSSIIYVSHPRFSEVKRIESSYRESFFKSGEYVQYILECRVHPDNIKNIACETLGAASTTIDSNISNDTLDWVINHQNKQIVDFNDPDASIICTGIMVRITDNHPGLLPESEWWYKSHLCNNKICCASGIDRDVLKRLIDNKHTCNIIYD